MSEGGRRVRVRFERRRLAKMLLRLGRARASAADLRHAVPLLLLFNNDTSGAKRAKLARRRVGGRNPSRRGWIRGGGRRGFLLRFFYFAAAFVFVSHANRVP